MEEKEAFTLWCPFVRNVTNQYESSSSTNNETDSFSSVTCKGKGCMMWRQFIITGIVGYHGYCGLAGKPV